jgi:hypothetical protein
MKKIILIIALTALTATPIYAQTKLASPSGKISPTAKPTQEATSSSIISKLKQIETLKEKIATKVAELREKDTSGILGTIKKIDSGTMIVTSQGVDKKVTYSDDTVYYQLKDGDRTDAKNTILKEGALIGIVGIYNSDKSSLAAKTVYTEDINYNVYGKVSDIDRDSYTITVKTKDGSQVVDIETTTKVFIYSENKKVEKSGFSKLKVGDPVHVFSTFKQKESGKIRGDKIYALPFLNAEPTAIPTSKADDKSASPTAVKVSPTSTKITPTVTPKVSVTIKPTAKPTSPTPKN